MRSVRSLDVVVQGPRATGLSAERRDLLAGLEHVVRSMSHWDDFAYDHKYLGYSWDKVPAAQPYAKADVYSNLWKYSRGSLIVDNIAQCTGSSSVRSYLACRYPGPKYERASITLAEAVRNLVMDAAAILGSPGRPLVLSAAEAQAAPVLAEFLRDPASFLSAEDMALSRQVALTPPAADLERGIQAFRKEVLAAAERARHPQPRYEWGYD